MDISQLLQPPFIYIIIGIVILAVISGSSSKKPKGKISGGFKAIPYINSKAEHNFHQQLQSKLPDSIGIAPKMRLADICKPDNPKNIVGFNKIARKHVDFVLFEQSSSRVLRCIELDDKSHNRRDSIARDKDKNFALKKAGIQLSRIKVTRNYSKQIDSILDGLNGHVASEPAVNTSNATVSTCPRCSSSDYQKVEMRLFNKGKHYYQCNYCSYQTEPSKS